MAKAKKEILEPVEEVSLDDLFKQISKGIGGELLEDRDKNQWGYIDTGILGLNYILSGKFFGGGVSQGSCLEIMGNSSSGKCFGKDTPILMYDGTTKMVQDIRVGDQVMGNDSKPRNVLNLTNGTEMLYKVSPSHKKHEKKILVPFHDDTYIVNESHILTLKRCQTKPTKRGGALTLSPNRKVAFENHPAHKNGVFNITVRDFLKESKTFRGSMRGYRTGVTYSSKEVKIDPYFLGVWLGDGNSSTTGVTTMDKEIVDVIYNEAKIRGLKVRPATKENTQAITYYLAAEKEDMPKIDDLYAYSLAYPNGEHKRRARTSHSKIVKLLNETFDSSLSICTVPSKLTRVKNWIDSGNKMPELKIDKDTEKHKLSNSHYRNSLLNDLNFYKLVNNKHIPHDYMTNSRENRLAILAGLIDTDGYVDGENTGLCFVNKNKKLACDVFLLGRSLGFQTSIVELTKSTQDGVEGIYYRVGIHGRNLMDIPVKLTYKKPVVRRRDADNLKYGIKVEPIGNGHFYGFEIDGNQLFLLGDYTVVHNSLIGTNILRGCQTAKGIPVMLDAERTISKKFAVTASHIDPCRFIVLESDTLESCFNKIHATIRNVRQTMKVDNKYPLAIVYDSIAVSPSQREFAETEIDMETATQAQMKAVGAGSDKPGERAKICSKELRKIPPILNTNNCCLIIINQIREKIGIMFGSNETTTSGRALEFYTSARLKTTGSKHIKDHLDKVIGINMNIKCIKNKCHMPFGQLNGLRVFFNKGIDPFGGLLELLLQTGRISSSGKAGSYKVSEPYAGGKEITFKSSKERNDVPAQTLLDCPALVDAEKPEQIQYYIDLFGDAIDASNNDIGKEEDMPSEE